MQSISNTFNQYEEDVYSDIGNLAMVGAFDTDQNEVSTSNIDYSTYDHWIDSLDSDTAENLPSYISDTQEFFMSYDEKVGCTHCLYANYDPYATVDGGCEGWGQGPCASDDGGCP